MSESSLSLPTGSYIYKLIHTSQNAALAAISSDDSLRVFNPEQLQLQASGIFHKTHEGVTCLEPFDADPHCILTAGRDGAARCWDLRSQRETFGVKDGKQERKKKFGGGGCVCKIANDPNTKKI